MGSYWGDGPRRPDLRGSVYDRRARKRWLLREFGDGKKAKCSFCPTLVTYATIFVDRIVPGEQGGRYTRDNIRPSCGRCSHAQGPAVRDGVTDSPYVTPI